MSTIAAAPTRRPLRITDRGRAVLAVLVAIPLTFGVVMIGSSLGAGNGAADASVHGDRSLQYVTVQQGDSLWSIAERVAPNADPRDVSAEFDRVNALNSDVLQPGQRLVVPSEYAH